MYKNYYYVRKYDKLSLELTEEIRFYALKRATTDQQHNEA